MVFMLSHDVSFSILDVNNFLIPVGFPAVGGDMPQIWLVMSNKMLMSFSFPSLMPSMKRLSKMKENLMSMVVPFVVNF